MDEQIYYSELSMQIADESIKDVYQTGVLLNTRSLFWTLLQSIPCRYDRGPFFSFLLNIIFGLGVLFIIHRYSALGNIYKFLLMLFLIAGIPMTSITLTGGYKMVELFWLCAYIFLVMRWLVNGMQSISISLVLVTFISMFASTSTLILASAAILVLLLQKRFFDAIVLSSTSLLPLFASVFYFMQYTEFLVPPVLWITFVNSLFFDFQVLISLLYHHDLVAFWAMGGILVIISLTNGKGWDRSKLLLMIFIFVGLEVFFFFPHYTFRYTLNILMVLTGLIAIFTWLYQSSIMAEKKHVRMIFITAIVLFSSVYPLWDRMDRPVKQAIMTSQYHVSKLFQDISQLTMHQN
jgi:hypothetical protein